MNDVVKTKRKLQATAATSGGAGEHSPYYRRLLSAGYKGFLQGTIGGATFYGFLGAAIGTAVAVPAAFFIGPAVLWLIPAISALGVMKGATTFGNIGSIAAITAESADLGEKRRLLIDLYSELPASREYDDEAARIKNILYKQQEQPRPPEMFHWQAVFIGAALGAAICAGFILLAPAIATHASIFAGIFETLQLFEVVNGVATTHLAAGVIPIAAGIGTALGALAGATIGLDRWYVRRWLDVAQNVVHDSRKTQKEAAERDVEIELMGRPSPLDYDTRGAELGRIRDYTAPIPPESIKEQPGTRVQKAALEERIASAVHTPAI